MARSPLTLAALASSAVPDLAVSGARGHSADGAGEFDSAVLTSPDGSERIVRVPLTQAAETEQSSDLVALRALTTGIRSRLPFDVPTYLGQTPVGGTRAIVYDFLPGEHVAVEDVPPGDGLAGSIGHAIAAIHTLPTSFVGEAGLPVLSAQSASRRRPRSSSRPPRPESCPLPCASAGATPSPTTRSGSFSRP